jgi:hypothetical protein
VVVDLAVGLALLEINNKELGLLVHQILVVAVAVVIKKVVQPVVQV